MRHQFIAAEAFDVGAQADHRLGQRMRAKAGPVKQFVGRRHRVVFVFGELMQQHVALVRQLSLGEGGVLDHVAQHAHEQRRVRAQPAHVEGGVVFVGVGIDLGPQPLGVQVQPARVALGRALEHHVLDHMADAVQRPPLMAAAAAHEHTDAGGVPVRHDQCQHPHAVVQRVQLGG